MSCGRLYQSAKRWDLRPEGPTSSYVLWSHFGCQNGEREDVKNVGPAIDGGKLSLNPNTIAIFLRILRNDSAKMPRDNVDYCLEVRNSCSQVHPRLMSLIPGSDIDPGLTVVNYSAEIESEVDAIYKHMYDEQTSIDEVIALLQHSEVSSDIRDEIVSCMLHFLFDEYKFFRSYYPARELAMTGYLFGSIIHHDIVDSVPLGIAIRYGHVVNALNRPPDTNIFKSGLQALSHFDTRLAERQPLCQALLRIPHLMEVRPDLTAVIHHDIVVAATDPAVMLISAFDAEIVEPPEELSDKILFIVNNLAPSNFDAKLLEMKDRFDDTFSRRFANYLVDQHISTEPNNRQLYLRFLDAGHRIPYDVPPGSNGPLYYDPEGPRRLDHPVAHPITGRPSS
ncbi:hypothetical protein EV424DRAFT_1577373 [Suillus variegatus]|nr:hypothetical protein EV424DRAFT_1577373 [Suillus variegatus]